MSQTNTRQQTNLKEEGGGQTPKYLDGEQTDRDVGAQVRPETDTERDRQAETETEEQKETDTERDRQRQ